MNEKIEREVMVEAGPEEVWDAITADGWLADEVDLDLRPGGDATFRSGEEVKTGWVEEASAPERIAFWWSADGAPATRVELIISEDGGGSVVRVVESRPLEVLDLVGIPLPGGGEANFGPALIAA